MSRHLGLGLVQGATCAHICYDSAVLVQITLNTERTKSTEITLNMESIKITLNTESTKSTLNTDSTKSMENTL
jgi:hypothetical protein